MTQDTLVLFGATGDWAKRKIYPALYNLFLDQRLPEGIKIIGLGRKSFTATTFREFVKRSLENFSRRPVQIDGIQKFLECFQFIKFEIDQCSDYCRLFNELESRRDGQKLFYLSVSPTLIETIVGFLSESGFAKNDPSVKILIEKPFGSDLSSAIELNDYLTQRFKEDQLYRIDHFIGKSMVQQIDFLLHHNSLFKSLWTPQSITKLEFIATETIGVEDRAKCYDASGALRDMIQNHLLQLYMIVVTGLSSIPNKVAALKELDPNVQIILGQYRAGIQMGKSILGYREETGIPFDSQTETYVSATTSVQGIPVQFISGKRMDKKCTQVIIHFQESRITFAISPEESILFELNGSTLSSPTFDFTEAYENILFDALNSNKRFFAHWDEVKAAWEYVEPMLQQMMHQKLPLYFYPAGSKGPEIE